MARVVRAKEKKQTKKSVTDDVYVAHSVQRMYNKTAHGTPWADFTVKSSLQYHKLTFQSFPSQGRDL